MTQRKPLVIVAGQIEQLQSGDSIAQESDIQLTADATLIAGSPVYMSAADHINKGKADAAATAVVVGLTTAAITSGNTGGVQTGGVLTLSTAQWDAAFGTTGGLVFNTIYYLSTATAGLGQATAPTVVGQFVKQIGVGLSTTEMQIAIQQSILL